MGPFLPQVDIDSIIATAQTNVYKGAYNSQLV